MIERRSPRYLRRLLAWTTTKDGDAITEVLESQLSIIRIRWLPPIKKKSWKPVLYWWYRNSLKESHSLCFRCLKKKCIILYNPDVRAPNEQKTNLHVMNTLILILLIILAKWSKLHLDILSYFWIATVVEFLDLKLFNLLKLVRFFSSCSVCHICIYAWVMSYFFISGKRNSFVTLSADLVSWFIWVNWEH